jgi:hypothetical protein
MPRSERCRIRGNCLDGIALPFLAQAPVAGGPCRRRRPGAGRAPPALGGPSGRSEPSNGLEPFGRPLAGLGERSKAVSEALRTVARAWASDKAELEDGSGSGRKRASWGWVARAGRGSQAWAHGGRWIGFGGARRLEILTVSGGSWRGLRLPQMHGSSSYGQNPIDCYGGFGRIAGNGRSKGDSATKLQGKASFPPDWHSRDRTLRFKSPPFALDTRSDSPPPRG